MLRVGNDIYISGEKYERPEKGSEKLKKLKIRQALLNRKKEKLLEKADTEEAVLFKLEEKISNVQDIISREVQTQTQHKRLKRGTVKRSDKKAEQMILDIIGQVKKDYRLGTMITEPAVSREAVASSLRLPEGQVDRIFQKLNREGILSQAKRRYAHDTNRNPMFDGSASGWASNYYKILR